MALVKIYCNCSESLTLNGEVIAKPLSIEELNPEGDPSDSSFEMTCPRCLVTFEIDCYIKRPLPLLKEQG